MTAADRVKKLCKEKGIAVYQLEKDLGFANAYISRIKKDSLPYDRAAKIADYLDVTIEYIQTGEEAENVKKERLSAYERKLIEFLTRFLTRQQKNRLFKRFLSGDGGSRTQFDQNPHKARKYNKSLFYAENKRFYNSHNSRHFTAFHE